MKIQPTVHDIRIFVGRIDLQNIAVQPEEEDPYQKLLCTLPAAARMTQEEIDELYVQRG